MSRILINKARNLNVLRKLDFKEVGIIKRGWDQNSLIQLQIKSKVDLFDGQNLSLLKQSILQLMQHQVFLRSQIVKTGEQNNEYSFVRTDLSNYTFENVKFLRFNNNKPLSIDAMKSVSDLLMEYFAANEINPDVNENQLLWKLYVLEICRREHIYDFKIILHHSITQAMSTILNFFKLLEIFHTLHQNKHTQIELKEEPIFQGCEAIFNIVEKYEAASALEPTKRPSFIDPNRARAESISRQLPAALATVDPKSELICVNSNTRFETIGNLIQMSPQNHVKFTSLDISK